MGDSVSLGAEAGGAKQARHAVRSPGAGRGASSADAQAAVGNLACLLPVRRAMPPHPLVSLRDAGRRVGDRWVWRGLGLDVRPGDRLAVRGPSGAGKTLLLRVLAGLDALDEGCLLSGGAPVADLPRHRAAVAAVAQRPALFDGTVRDNLEAPFAFVVREGTAYDEDRARALLARLGRGDEVLDQSVEGLSGGEAQTVGLVRALLTDPAVVLLDEPTAGLDPERAHAVEAVVEAFLAVDPSRAAVWTSHDAAQLDRVTTRALDL